MSRAAKRIDPVNATIAAGIWLVVITVYWFTKAPTLSLWDCGEFIAASYILGVPHPPGTPLYVLMGRVFSIIPVSADIGLRVNLLSAVASSFTAVFGYLAGVRILTACFSGDKSLVSKVMIYAGAAAGAFLVAFGLTNWNNSVEAEVYGMSMMMLMAVLWLALVYRDHAGSAFGERVMLLVYFIAFAGIGVHMTTFLALPALSLLFILKKDAARHVWYAVVAFVIFELYLIFALSSRPGEIPYYVPILIVFIFYLFYIFSYERIPSIYLVVAGLFLLSVLPVAGPVLKAVRGDSGIPDEDMGSGVLSGIGQVCFGVFIVVAIVLFFIYLRKEKDSEARRHYLVTSLFILASGLMTLVLISGIKGHVAFLLATAFLGFAFAVALRKYLNWPVLAATILVSLVVIGVEEFFIGLAVGVVLVPIIGLLTKQRSWKNALLILLVAVLGYSTHVYIPIRSAQNPVINENNPSQNLTATINYIERKQYGSQSMIERMFERRAEWENQFGNFRRMGFWHFFQQQYGLNGVRFVPVFIIGLYGLWEVVRRRPREGVPFLVLILLASVGLVLYMNFADGMRQHPVTGEDYIEVRDRDYFFTPAFILFALAIGIGITGVVQFIKDALWRSGSAVKKGMVYLSLLVCLFPVYTLAQNYYYSDRSNNYIAYDYAWNLLTSAEPNAVLITVGDNDTFPLWCLQEAYGVRKDVDVVNLSLANARWYIKQLKHTLGIDLRWTDSDIDSLLVLRDQNGNIYRLKHQVVAELINCCWDRRPINFAVTVLGGDRKFMGQSLDSLLILRGLVRSLDTTSRAGNVDVEACIDFYTNPDKMRYRSIADPAVYKTETGLRLTRNYLQSFMEVTDSLVALKDYERAEWLMKEGIKRIPHAGEGVNYLAALYAEQGKRDQLQELIETPGRADPRWLKILLGRMEKRLGNPDKAEEIYRQLLAESPRYRIAMEELVRFYYANRALGPLRQILQTWVAYNPEDREIVDLLNGIEEQLKKLDSAAAATNENPGP